MRGWIYRNVIFSFPTIFGGGDYIVTLYFHPWQYLVRGWIYRDIIFSLLTIFGAGVIISWHYIFTPDNIWSGGDYIVTQYSHPWQYLVRGWLYRDIIFSLLTIFHEGVIISWNDILTPGNIWWGGIYILTYFHSWQYLVRGDYIVTLYFHPWQYLVGGWLYRDTIFSSLTISGQGVIISWHHIFTPDNISWRGDYIVKWYSHSWQYLVRGYLYPDIFSLLTIFHEWWLYRDIIFSPLTVFGRGVIISWHNILTPDNIWCRGDCIVTSYFHFWPDNILWGGDYIVTWYSLPWQYLVRGWLYRDIIFSLLAIFGQGVIISWHYIFTPDNIWWGMIISWHIFTPEDIWWGGDYIMTYFHSWRYLVRGWLYRDITISFLTLS